MDENSKCGLCGIHPKFLRKWATTRIFILVFGLLGMIQSMSFIYIIVNITTLEKRFKIPSKTFGVMLSGNEISQILSIVLIYFGGTGHRPRWIAIGVALSAASCFIFALPHFIYGPGEQALALTHEYHNQSLKMDQNSLRINHQGNKDVFCSATLSHKHEKCSESINIVPSLLIFFSQFVLGIGTSLYYGLGTTYMDDNTKKANVPMVLGLTYSLRTIGPVLGFVLGYFCLKLYIDPNLHPIIDDKDPRWLGAWWLGWLLLGATMMVFAAIFSLFPRELRVSKNRKFKQKSKQQELAIKVSNCKRRSITISTGISSKSCTVSTGAVEPSIKDFSTTMTRILTNKLLMSNIIGGVFYVLSSSAFISFLAKYLEVQFMTSPGGGTIFTGPMTFAGVIFGLLLSGYVIGKYKPRPRVLMGWNVFVGVSYVIGQIIFIFLGCDGSKIQGINYDTMAVNLTSACNLGCNCDQTKYSPVCHVPSGITYFSACHAGCMTRLNDSSFGSCQCAPGYPDAQLSLVVSGPCKADCFRPYLIFSALTTFINVLMCSGRIGNVLVNFRAVETRDKSIAQGFMMLAASLFGLIPGPIIFGAVIDSTCLLWDVECGRRGNCWVYHKKDFRYYINAIAACFSSIGVLFDVLVCYYVKGVDLYGDTDPKNTDSAPNNNRGEGELGYCNKGFDETDETEDQK